MNTKCVKISDGRLVLTFFFSLTVSHLRIPFSTGAGPRSAPRRWAGPGARPIELFEGRGGGGLIWLAPPFLSRRGGTRFSGGKMKTSNQNFLQGIWQSSVPWFPFQRFTPIKQGTFCLKSLPIPNHFANSYSLVSPLGGQWCMISILTSARIMGSAIALVIFFVTSVSLQSAVLKHCRTRPLWPNFASFSALSLRFWSIFFGLQFWQKLCAISLFSYFISAISCVFRCVAKIEKMSIGYFFVPTNLTLISLTLPLSLSPPLWGIQWGGGTMTPCLPPCTAFARPPMAASMGKSSGHVSTQKRPGFPIASSITFQLNFKFKNCWYHIFKLFSNFWSVSLRRLFLRPIYPHTC